MSRSTTDRVSLISRLDGHFGRCAAIAAAGIGVGDALLGSHQSADAAIQYSGVVNINIPSTTSGVYLNVVTGVSNASPSLVPGWDVNPWSSSGLGLFNPSAPSGGVYVATTSGGTTAVNLVPGTLISAASLFGSNSSTNNSQWVLNSSNNCIGFRLQNEANGNAIHYGWMRVTLDGTAGGQPRSILDYAYETVAGVGINACPEPTSMTLLALGAAGLMIRRRR